MYFPPEKFQISDFRFLVLPLRCRLFVPASLVASRAICQASALAKTAADMQEALPFL